MTWIRTIVLALLGRYGARLRFPVLLVMTAGLFAFDVVLPDGIPFVDELILGLLTALLASWKKDDDVLDAEAEAKSGGAGPRG